MDNPLFNKKAPHPGQMQPVWYKYLREISDYLKQLSTYLSGLSLTTAPQIFTSSGTYTNPSATDAQLIYLTGIAAGGSGGGSSAAGGNDGGGGGAGSRINRYPWVLAAGATLTITIPGDTAANAAGDNNGNNGGNLVITDGTTTLTIPGGRFGARGTVKTGGLGGGWASTAVGQNDTAQGAWVWSGAAGSTGTTAARSGSSENYQGVVQSGDGGSGGSSPWGFGGLGGANNQNGVAPAADAWGAGGGGAGGGGAGNRSGAIGRQGYLQLEFC